jgi:hypothetical protein
MSWDEWLARGSAMYIDYRTPLCSFIRPLPLFTWLWLVR